MKQCNNPPAMLRKAMQAGATIYQKGFTLIELLIYTSILVIVLAFTVEFLYAIGQARLSSGVRLEIAQNAQLVMSKFKSDLAEADSINVPADANPSSNLSFVLAEGHTVIYTMESDILKRIYDADDLSLISNQVRAKSLSFQKVANPGGRETIEIKFSLEPITYLSGGRNVAENFQTTASLK